MHNLALELLAHGYQITGSDDEIFDPAKTRLAEAGILPASVGWFPEKIHNGLDGIVLGMHAKQDNPELLKANELGIKVYSFPEFIFEQSRNKKRVVIGGSHGKTTCTAMLMHVLKQCDIEFDYLVGSQLSGFERMVKISNAPLIIIEGDEYLTSALDRVPKFHRYLPHLAMITGVAWDHINVFPTFDDYISQFEIFITTIQKGGKFFWFESDPVLEKLAGASKTGNESYKAPVYNNTDGKTVVQINGNSYPLQIFGRHNLENAQGVSLLAGELGIDSETFWTCLGNFEGTSRRLEKVFENEHLTIIRDFAHAPSKVAASVKAVREKYPDSGFIAVFELHTYSSLREDFLPGYKGSLAAADYGFVLYDPHVYKLKGMPVPNASIIENSFENISAISASDLLLEKVRNCIAINDKTVLLLMSSGNLGGIQPKDFCL